MDLIVSAGHFNLVNMLGGVLYIDEEVEVKVELKHNEVKFQIDSEKVAEAAEKWKVHDTILAYE